MNKADLIKVIAAEAGITQAAAKLVIESLLENVSDTLKNGGRVSLIGFGSWSVTKKPARVGRNPQTGQQINISEKHVVKFKAGNILNSGGGTIGGGARIRKEVRPNTSQNKRRK